MNLLLSTDAYLTAVIYDLPHNALSNRFFQFMSAIGDLAFIWIIILIFVSIAQERKNRIFVVFFFGTILFAAVFSNYFLKNIFDRPRPLSAPIEQEMITFDKYPQDFSFPSGHATVAFSAAALMAYFEKKKRWFFYTIAFLIAFSRVYLGYHYVLDVVGGAYIGWIISRLALRWYKGFR